MNNYKPVVAHINNVFFAGSETFIYHYISNLKRFHPICLSWTIKNLEQFNFPMNDIYLLTFKRYTTDWIFYGGIRKYFGIDLFAENICRKRKVKLIHTHFGTNGAYSLKLKKRLKIPLIITFYGFDVSVYDVIEKNRKNYLELFQEGELFLVEGNFMKNKLISLGCPESKIKIQRIAIPIKNIEFRCRKPKKKKEKIKLIFAGRFVEKKGLIYALKAIKEVYDITKAIEFFIIGDGPLKKEIEEFIKKNKMEYYVRLLGFLSYSEYLKEMQNSDIFIHPSITATNGDSEGGAPTTILEAQAMGMPVISTNHCDIPNIVIPGKSALLSEEKDWEGIANNILYLIKNQEIWENMGKIGREFVEKYHNIDNEVVLLEEKYLSLIN